MKHSTAWLLASMLVLFCALPAAADAQHRAAYPTLASEASETSPIVQGAVSSGDVSIRRLTLAPDGGRAWRSTAVGAAAGLAIAAGATFLRPTCRQIDSMCGIAFPPLAMVGVTVGGGLGYLWGTGSPRARP